jgi:exodeoxyribonuclease VII large subunit
MIQDDLFSTRPEKPNAKSLSVSELNRRIKSLIERELGTLWVEGEVSNYRPATSGHIYFTLKDEASQIPVAFFKGSQRGFKLNLKDGMKVRVFGDVTMYLERGQHQLIARMIEESGKGDLQKAFEELKEKLQKEGLFDTGRKRPIPFLPRHIGIVTSPTGAAIRDMLNILRRRFSNLHIVIAPVKVQGDGAAREIATAIDLLNKREDLDVLIIGRGGGNIEDLWSFNEEVVARAIFRSRLPVISAVGHEIDFTISDFVADLRAPTPSAAAEIVVRPRADFEEQIRSLSKRLAREPGHMMMRFRQEIQSLRLRLVPSLRSEYVERQQRVDEAQLRMIQKIRSTLRERSLLLHRIEAQLRALGPHAVLERGYSITRTKNGKVVTRTNDVGAGQEITTLLSDGEITSVVNSR